MRKILICLIVSILALCFPEALNTSVARGCDTGFTVTFTVPEPQITEIDGKEKISVDDFVNSCNPGQPMLPEKVYRLLIPPNSENVNFEIIDSKKKKLEGNYDIRLGLPISDGSHVNTSSPYSEDSLIKISGISNNGNAKFISLKIFPFEYDKTNKKLSYYKTVTVRISYVLNNSSLLSVFSKPKTLKNKDFDDYYNKNEVKALNYAVATLPSETHLLIIIPSCLENLSALSEFKKYKKSEGYTVVTQTTENIYSQYYKGDNVEKIRDYLTDYRGWIGGNFYLLLIGSPYNSADQTNQSTGGTIPMRYFYPDPLKQRVDNNAEIDGRVPSDYYYAELDGNWDANGNGFYGEYNVDTSNSPPDVYVGRIPFDDPNIVSLILQKSLAFEQRQSDKKKILYAGAFTNFKVITQDEAVVMEEAMWPDFLETKGFSKTTLYEGHGTEDSLYLSICSKFLSDENLTNYIKNDTFGIVAWTSHGYPDKIFGLTKYFNMEFTNTFLTNKDTQSFSACSNSIYFSGACLTSTPDWKDGPSLSMNLLKTKAATIVGATRTALGIVGWHVPSDSTYAAQTIEYYYIKSITEGKTCGQSLYETLFDYPVTYGVSDSGWVNVFNFASLYGDPTLRLENQGININATLNGSSWEGDVNYTVSGPEQIDGTQVPLTASKALGTYTLTYNSGGPDGATLSLITPMPTQTLSSGSSITFTLNFVTSASYTGNIVVNAILNGASWEGPVSYSITGPTNINGSSVSSTYSNRPVGKYTLTYSSGGPDDAFLANISQSPVQNLSSGGTIYFTLEFETNLPSIALTSPKGGEIYSKDGPILITWSSHNLIHGSIELFYSPDGFNNLYYITTLSLSSTSYAWTDHDFQSNDCYIVVANYDGTDLICFDYNKWTPFTISNCEISLNYPAGNEIFTAGDQVTITWTSQNLTIGLISLFYSTDGFESLNPIAELPLTSTSYTWSTLPNVQSDKCYIVVANFDGAELIAFDYNKWAPFSINLVTNKWMSVSNGIIYSSVNSIAIDPTNTQIIYVGVSGGGIYKSIDGGAYWTRIKGCSAFVPSLAIDHNDTQIIYAGTWGAGIYKSIDGGSTWVQINNGLTDTYPSVFSVVINPADSQILYSGTWDGGIYKSIDGGLLWTKIYTPGGSSVLFLAIDPTNTQIIYAATRCTGIYKSINGGSTWAQMINGLTSTFFHFLAIDPTNTQIIYAGSGGRSGVFKSTDGGSSWTSINDGLIIEISNGMTTKYNLFFTLVVDPTNTQIVYIGSNYGLFKTTNGGSNWFQVNNGLTSSGVGSLAIDPYNSQIVYAGSKDAYSDICNNINGNGLFKTTNGGSNWFQVNNGFTSRYVNIFSLAINPTNTQIIYAGTYYGGGVFKSIDGGNSWTQVNNGFTGKYVNISSLAIDPTNTQVIYAGTADGVFKSINSGISWTQMNNGLTSTFVYSLAINPTNTQIIYAGTGGGDVFKSTDGGLFWTRIYTTGFSVLSLAIDSTNTQIIYAGTYSGGVFKSTNDGESWYQIGLAVADRKIMTLAIDQINPQIIYTGTSEYPIVGSIFKSTDGGVSWSQINSSLGPVNSLLIDPNNTQSIYGGTDYGVFQSTDGGVSWFQINNGLTYTHVYSLAIDPTNTQIIYAGTYYGGGVFKYIYSNITPPSAAQNLTATTGDSQITLNWDAPSDNGGVAITSYKIYRGTTPGSAGTMPITTVDGSTLTYTDTGLTNGTTYYYKISAVNSAGEGPQSNETSAMPVSQTYTVAITDTTSIIKWYDPVPDFSTPGTVNSVNDTLVYRMGDTIHGNLNFNPTQVWEIQLKKTDGAVIDTAYMASGGNGFTIGTSNITVDGEYYLTVHSSTNEFMDFNSNHFYIMYNLTWSANEIIPGQSTQTISGWIIRGNGQTIVVPVTVYVAYPNNTTAGYYTVASNSSGQFSITFPTYSGEGDYNIYIRDDYDITNADNDAMIYDMLSGFSSTPTVTLTQPNGGETLNAGTPINVTWTISGDTSLIDHISVDYTTDNGATWHYGFGVFSGFSSSMSHNWTVPNVSSTNCILKIAIKRTDGTWSVDCSDNVFTIQPAVQPPTPTLTQPNGSETLTAAGTYSVTWTIAGDTSLIQYIVVDYSTDNGVTWHYGFGVFSGFSSSMSHNWTVPNVSSTNCILKIAIKRTDGTWSVDYSDNVFTIQPAVQTPTPTLTQPNGSETLTAAGTYSVTWTIAGDTSLIQYIVVDYSTDNGVTWHYGFGVFSGFSSSMSHNWTVPNVSSTNCILKIAIKRTDGTWSVDYSDNVFTIQPAVQPPIPTLTQPNGSETLTAAGTYSVTWAIAGDTSLIQYIAVDYSTDNGVTWHYGFGVFSGFSSSMSHNWTVPNVSSTNCILKIAIKRTDGTWSVDYSDNVFTIQ